MRILDLKNSSSLEVFKKDAKQLADKLTVYFDLFGDALIG